MSQSGSRADDNGTAGVVARPPLIFLSALALGSVTQHLLPLHFPSSRVGPAHWISAVVAGTILLGGVTVFVAGIRNFKAAATPIPTTQPSRVLVTTGIHGRTRNPIYVGMFLVYCGIGLLLRNPWVLILVLPLAITIRYGVVAREEAYLHRLFGDAYRVYQARVPRWL